MICTALEAQGKGSHIERAAVASNKEMWRLVSQLKFALVDIDRKMRTEGYREPLKKMASILAAQSV